MENKVKYKLDPCCISYDLAKKIYDKGLILECDYAYYNEQDIKPSIRKKYGDLTDDGYFELTVDGGGNLEWEDVYYYKIALKKYRGDIDDIEAFAPSSDSLLKFFINEVDIKIEILYVEIKDEFTVICHLEEGYVIKCPSMKERDDALENAFLYLITLLKVDC